MVKIFVSKATGDEMASDAYPHELAFGGAVWKFDFQMLPYRFGEDVELRGEELADAQAEGDVEYAVSIARKYQLESTELSKSAFLAWLKKSIQAQMPEVTEEEKADWQAGCQAFAKHVVSNFKTATFYCGESGSMDSLAICVWGDDGMSGSLYLMAKGVKLTKF